MATISRGQMARLGFDQPVKAKPVIRARWVAHSASLSVRLFLKQKKFAFQNYWYLKLAMVKISTFSHSLCWMRSAWPARKGSFRWMWSKSRRMTASRAQKGRWAERVKPRATCSSGIIIIVVVLIKNKPQHHTTSDSVSRCKAIINMASRHVVRCLCQVGEVAAAKRWPLSQYDNCTPHTRSMADDWTVRAWDKN